MGNDHRIGYRNFHTPPHYITWKSLLWFPDIRSQSTPNSWPFVEF